MSQQELLKKVLSALNEHDIPYMLTGSIVSSIQGEPRLSHDIDIIISTDRHFITILQNRFDRDDYYFDDVAVHDAFSSQTMFNLIDISGGDKIDFWILTDSAFDHSRFERRIRISLFETPAWVSTPEDTILAKLLWAKKSGGSEKQLADVRQVYTCSLALLDRPYIEKWSLLLGVKKYWEGILQSSP